LPAGKFIRKGSEPWTTKQEKPQVKKDGRMTPASHTLEQTDRRRGGTQGSGGWGGAARQGCQHLLKGRGLAEKNETGTLNRSSVSQAYKE